jgi:tRNA-intron endonuclease
MITAYIVGGEVVSTSQDAFSAFEKSQWGEKKGKRIVYSSFEVLSLFEGGKMKVFVGKKELGEDELRRKLRRGDKKFETKYAVFSDLRGKGYVVKTALKFGAEFRVYDKGDRPGGGHAKWILFTAREGEKMSMHDFSAKNRVAHSTKKFLMLGVVDDEGDVTYYEVRWERP